MPDNARPAASKGIAPEAGGGAAEVLSPTNLDAPATQKRRPHSGGSRTSKIHGIREDELPPDRLTTKKIRMDQARSLAVTRRKRISEFAIGGFVAALPGAAETAVGALNTHQLPPPGHLVEILLAVMFGTGLLVSLFRFDEPIARDVLEEIFPAAAKDMGFFWRVGKLCRRALNDLLGR
jgi:hypothetical protein